MAYPSRPRLKALPEFVGTAVTRPTPEQRTRLVDFVAAGYLEGRSLRELAELTDRTQTAIRGALAQAQVPLRGSGAPPLRPDPTRSVRAPRAGS